MRNKVKIGLLVGTGIIATTSIIVGNTTGPESNVPVRSAIVETPSPIMTTTSPVIPTITDNPRKPSPKATKPKPVKKSKPAKKKESVRSGFVHPGARCSDTGGTGYSKKGKLYVCRTGDDGIGHWKRY